MRWPGYSTYKESRVQWLGKVPEHWDVKRGRFVMRVNPPAPLLRNLEDDQQVSFVPMEAVNEYGGISLDQTRVKADVGGGYTEFQDGDVVIAKITPCFENGKGSIATGLVNSAAYGTTELHVLRASESFDYRYLFYLTITDGYRKLGESEMYGAGGQKRVPPEFCKDFSRNFRQNFARILRRIFGGFAGEFSEDLPEDFAENFRRIFRRIFF